MTMQITGFVAAIGLIGTAAQAQDPHSLIATLIGETGSPGAATLQDCGQGPVIDVAGVRIAGRDHAITPDDIWHLGSNTKAMTATLAARLVERGHISWDTTLGEALLELDVEIHPDLAQATLADLLTHQSGIMPNPGLMTTLRLVGADGDRDLAADRVVYARAVLAEPAGPRGDFMYSNAGYVMAGLMLEMAVRVPYETLMAEEVFEPLGMDSAGWGPPGVAGEADQPRGHRPGFFGGLGAREPGAGADNPPSMNAGGRGHVSLQDLAAFLRSHAVRAEAYLTAESWDRLQTSASDANYAMGWGVSSDGVLSHSGSNTMWYMQMSVNIQTGCVAAVALNDGRIDEVSGPVAQLTRALLTPE